jgi:hypothetical protein
MTTVLTPPSVVTVKAVINFSKQFGVDIVKLTSTMSSAIDDTPTLFIVFDGISYAGPDIVLTRVRDLANRLALPEATITVVTGGVEDKPKSLKIKSGRSTFDFKLASDKAADRLPSKFTGTIVHELDIAREDYTAAIGGANSIGSDVMTFIADGSSLTLTAVSECETYTAAIDDVPTTSKFQYNYTVDFLSAVDKILPKTVKTVSFGVSAKGHMRINLPTEAKQITADVYLLDVKNR